MLVKNIMTKTVYCAEPDETITVIARKMRDQQIGAIPVCKDGRVKGFVTDRDIVTRAVAQGTDLANFKVKDIMTRTTFTVWENETVEDAVRLMESKHVRRLPVLGKTKKIVGLLSLDDIAIHSPYDLTGEALKWLSFSKTQTARTNTHVQPQA